MGRLLGILLLLAALGGAAWLFRDRIPGPWSRGEAQEATGVSPATAEAAEAKLQRLRDDGEEVALSGAEVTSLLRYRLQGGLAGRVHDPVVTFEGDGVRVTGRVPTEELPDVRELRAVREFLPDTADVSVQGKLRTLDDGRTAVKVDAVSFARVPVPQEVYARALERFGRQDEPGLAPDEYAVRLPPGVGAARVEGGRLVLSPAARP
ncbi:MAG TPA: hypothetical protein VFX98_05395 [Longimicrobiaceae bacterium]|nr:hypothetical protein [Longimicrobiaceae bacterium]